MTTSSNPKIQSLMNEVGSIDSHDPDMLDKLNAIAQKLAAEQRKVIIKLSGQTDDDSNLVDPNDEFACEGCQ
jgi:hypothetical protein